MDETIESSPPRRNAWDILSLVLAIATQVAVLGLAVLVIFSTVWTEWTDPLPHMSAIIILPVVPFVGLPLILLSLYIQWMRDEWHKWWNFAYGVELAAILFPMSAALLYGIGYSIASMFG